MVRFINNFMNLSFICVSMHVKLSCNRTSLVVKSVFTSHQLKFSATDTKHSLPSLLLWARRQLFSSDHLLVPGAFPSHNYTCVSTSLISSSLQHRIFQGPFLSSILGSALPVRFLNAVPGGNPVKCRFPDCDNSETTTRACMRWCRDEAQAWLCWPTVVSSKRCWEGAGCGKHTKCHKMNKQTSILGGFLVLQISPPKAPGSEEWKAMKNCSGRTKKSQYHLQKGSVLSCAPLHSHKWGGLQGWTRKQQPGRAGKQDFGRKEESWHRKKAQLKYPHPSSNFRGQRTTPLAATFMSWRGFPCKQLLASLWWQECVIIMDWLIHRDINFCQAFWHCPSLSGNR